MLKRTRILIISSGLLLSALTPLIVKNISINAPVFGGAVNCEHSGNHYLGKEATCKEAGNAEFWACCKCMHQYLAYPGGSFTDRGQYTGTLSEGHIAYIPKSTTHPAFNENGLCVEGCGASIAEAYNMSKTIPSGQSGQTLKDIGILYSDYTAVMQDSGGHLWGTYDFKANSGIDLYIDYKYTYNGSDSWFYIYLFNGKDESGPVVRINTNNPDGNIRGFVYTKNSYPGDFTVNPSETLNKFNCLVPTDGTNNYIRIKADLTDATNNTFTYKLFFGIHGGEEKQATINGTPVNLSITLGADYFNSGAHQTVRISNHNSNVQIKNHWLSGASICYYTEGGTFIGALPYNGSIFFPTLRKEDHEFLGWYLSDGHIATQGMQVDNNINLYPKFVKYTSVIENKVLTIAPGASQSISVSQSIGTDNYLAMAYTANGNLKGKFSMNASLSNFDEAFYLDKDEQLFTTFLDTFRNAGRTSRSTTIKTITLTNPGTTTVTFNLVSLKRAPRNYLIDDTLYLSDSTVRLGISMKLGGAISSLQNIKSDIVEYITSDNEVKIRERSKISETVKKTIKDSPNLINIYDLGREVQQSYYYDVTSANGYTQATYSGSLARYNPVQSGDCNYKESKIVDFRIDDKSIYVKVQAADWAKNNSLSQSYMTNTYTLKNGLVYVNNTFIDWYGFTNYDVPTSGNYPAGTQYGSTQELPAVYIVHPLSYFSTVYSTVEIYDDKSGWDLGTTKVESASAATIASFTMNPDGTYKASNPDYSYHYEFRVHPENYLGYFNEDKFGVAVYMNAGNFNHDSGNRHVYMNGNYQSSHNASLKNNRTYRPNLTSSKTLTESAFLSSPIESCYVDNTNYLTTVLGLIPSEYTKLDWSYAIGADYLPTLKSKFSSIKANHELYNDFTCMAGINI